MKQKFIISSIFAATATAQQFLLSCEIYCAYCEEDTILSSPNSKVFIHDDNIACNNGWHHSCNCNQVDECNARLDQGNWDVSPLSNDDHTILLLDESSSLNWNYQGNRGADMTSVFFCQQLGWENSILSGSPVVTDKIQGYCSGSDPKAIIKDPPLFGG